MMKIILSKIKSDRKDFMCKPAKINDIFIGGYAKVVLFTEVLYI